MSTIILGGGLAGLSLAYFLERDTIILEKEKRLGGLCKSFEFNKIMHDIGPHIFFSKNKKILNMITSLTETNLIRRSNKIFHKGKLIKYPFENDLATLDEGERDYCLKEFLNNPYENYRANNMLQFFLKTFGEGITRLYLQPYNEKIWKFDPVYMSTQMVERIPKPPKEDVIKSAEGIKTEGYLHQLYFHYPKKGGVQQLINSYLNKISHKSKIFNLVNIKKIYKKDGIWKIETNKGNFSCETLINCMPLHEILKYIEAPNDVKEALKKLKYNSLYVVPVQAKKDNIGNNFALYFADKNIIFHRISKLNFLGENYCLDNGGSTILVEITYRPHSYLSSLSAEEIKQKVLDDLNKLNLVSKGDILDISFKSFKYAYPIYDLAHKENKEHVLDYLSKGGIYCCGRFAEFEYLNMDAIVEHSCKLAKKLNEKKNG